VRDLQDTSLAAAFACRRNVRVAAAHPVELGVAVRATYIVRPLPRWIAPSPYAAKVAGCLTGAVRRAVPLVRAGRDNLEMRAAARTVLPGGCHIGLLTPPASASAASAQTRAVELIRPYGLECCGANTTGQVIHSGALS
jgi:hypothetical protein